MAAHRLEADARTLHGPFSRDRAAVLEIEPGDTVSFRTLDAHWNLEPHSGPGAISRQVYPRPAGHALCGPLHVRGAAPGMALGITVNRLRPAAWGWTRTNPEPALGIQGKAHWQLWALDGNELTGQDQAGRVVELRPFMGVMGLPPDEPGEHSTGPPRFCGGNLDCRELVVGSTLYLPVTVAGALFSTGDGHAAQGDGEVCGTAIECGMDECELAFSLHPEMRLSTPRAETPAGWLCLGLGADLEEAARHALSDMLDLLGERFHVERKEAMALASVVVSLRVTQVVNGVVGMHAVLPHGAVRPG